MIQYTSIAVPHFHDSFSRIVLKGEVYEIRFSYNNATDCWKFGLFDSRRQPLYQDVKIVPGIPLNHGFCQPPYPKVVFAARSKTDRIGYRNFWDGDAVFYYAEVVDDA